MKTHSLDSEGPQWLDREAYPFRNRYLGTKQGRLHYVDEGQGRTILFVHGTPTWSFEYRQLIKALATRYRCIAPDLLGFGLSERPPQFGYRPEDHAAVLREFVETLDLRDFTLVVHDFGGPIGLPLALDSSRTRDLIVLNTWMWPFEDPEMQKRAKVAGSALGRWMYKQLNFSQRILMPSVYADKRKLTAAIHRQYLQVFDDKEARVLVLWALAKALLGSGEFYRSLWDKRARLAGLRSLIVWGMKDTAFRPALLERWREVLPQAKIVTLPDAGHWPHEEAPTQVLAAIEDFLSDG
jgi:haloalkane dehalogenase